MPPMLRFIITRLISLPVTLLIITMIMYGFVMLTPPEVRATLYIPAGFNPDRMTEERLAQYIESIIKARRLRDPYPVQYAIWLSNLVRGDWGYSQILRENVLTALIKRTPVTAELTLYSMLLFIPLGLISGTLAGARKGRMADHRFRLGAFVATSIPTFVLALVFLSIFYVLLRWFPPERVSIAISQEIISPSFHAYTGMLTLDGILNGRVDISLDAARHLVLPVITLSLLYWATLGRVTRQSIIEELQKDYVIAGRARGLGESAVVWRHALRNALTPALTSSALAAASLFTGVFIVEVIYNFKGVSDIVVSTARDVPDAPAILGFAVYSVCIVLLIMLALDIIQAYLDPRVREGIIGS